MIACVCPLFSVFPAFAGLALAGSLVASGLLSLLAALLIAALAGAAWWYAQVNQASVAALRDLAGQLREQSRLVTDELLVMRGQFDLMRRQFDLMSHQWERQNQGRLEFWLTQVDDEDLRMPFKPPFGSKRNTLISGWILEAWNPSLHVVRLQGCTLTEIESGITLPCGSIRLIRAEEAWVLPLTELLLQLAGQISEQRDQGNWKKLQERPLTVEIALRYVGNDGREHCLRQLYQVQLAGGWERFDLRLTSSAPASRSGVAAEEEVATVVAGGVAHG